MSRRPGTVCRNGWATDSMAPFRVDDLRGLVSTAAHTIARSVSQDGTLPWRMDPTPYRVFLAEMMLVRTRWDVVAKHYDAVFARFPNLHALASASPSDILEALAPLGLRKRAQYLKRAALYLVEHFGGNIPHEPEKLKRVPGIGEYTANAIAALAYRLPVVPADANIFRFLSRLTGIPTGHRTKGSRALRSLLPFLSVGNGGPSVPTLLDFVRLICRPRLPKCVECPLASMCKFRETYRSADTA